MELRFFDDPVAFLDVAGDVLAEQPVLSTVIAGVAERIADPARGGVRLAGGRAVLVRGGARRRRRRGYGDADRAVRRLPGVPDADAGGRGPLRCRRHCSTATSRCSAPTVRSPRCRPSARTWPRGPERQLGSAQHTRLFELGDLVEPRPVTGRLRPATLDEQDLVASWYEAFMADADEQAGREPGESPHEAPTDEELRRRIEGRPGVRLGGRGRRQPVNVTAATAPTYGVSRIGPVYTPAEQRGRATPAPPCTPVSALLRAQRRAGLPVHRPGQPDLEQDLRGDRLPAAWWTWRICRVE